MKYGLKDQRTFNEDTKLWLEEMSSPRYKYITDYIKKILYNLNLKNKSILELGCGISSFFSVLKGNKIVGIDHSKELLAMNKSKNIKLICGDIRQTSNLTRKKFDLILAVNVIHHLPEKEHGKVINEISNALKTGGIFLIVEPNMHSLTGIYYCFRKFAEIIMPKKLLDKIIGFSTEEEKYLVPGKINKLLNQNGLAITKEYSISLLRLPPFKPLKKIHLEKINSGLDRILEKFKLKIGTVLIIMGKR